jgi:hypothetical protein
MHTVMGDIRHNTVSGARRHAIELTEMSMGAVERNDVRGAPLYCGDHSMCEIEGNRIVATPGPGIVALYYADAELDGNTLVDAGRPRAFANSILR